MPTRNPKNGVCANNYAMGAPLTPILPTLRHGPPNALCRSVARNYQFPCQGNEIVGKGGGRGGEGNQGGRQNWCSRQSVVGGFFRFFALGIFIWNFWEQKKVAGNSPAGPLSRNILGVAIITTFLLFFASIVDVINTKTSPTVGAACWGLYAGHDC